jgi:SAM-dependent methyltransferase
VTAGPTAAVPSEAAWPGRVVEPEVLDDLPADDPSARHSRRDLRVIHRFMGTRGILSRALRRVEAAAGRPRRVLEVGCGDGTLLLGVAHRLGWRDVELTLLDRQPAVEAPTLAAYAAHGWRARTVVADVFEAAGAAAGERHDLVVASLFLHHFDTAALGDLCRALAARAPAFVAYEPRRSRFALLGSRLVVLLGANAVTRTDAVLSVRAGFRGQELSDAWRSAVGPGWELEEGLAGPFGHRFCALRARG